MTTLAALLVAAVDPALGVIVAAAITALGLLVTGMHRARTVDRTALEQSDYHRLMEECRKLRQEQLEANERAVEASRRELKLEREIAQLKDQVAAQAKAIDQLRNDSASEIQVLKREVEFWRDRAIQGGGQQP